MMKFRRSKGFTLIELIMVIVIIGILAAIAVPRFVNLRQQARQAQCQGSVGAIRAAISNYYSWWVTNSAHYNSGAGYPPTVTALAAYFQDGSVPSTPGWLTTTNTWDGWYNATTGTIPIDSTCALANF